MSTALGGMMAAAILGALCLWGAAWARPWAYGALVVMVGLGLYSGHPSPVWMSYPDGVLASYQIDEARGIIYLWIIPSGSTVPIASTQPYSEEKAKKYQEKEQEIQQGRIIITHGELHDRTHTPLPPKQNLD